MVTKIFIGNDKLDLFGDENITINSSIQDTTDITKNTTDFSKTFTVPGNDINNSIFKHYYDATIDNSFDARIKVDGRIELDGIPFKLGKWRLNKVTVKGGHPSSYTINFFGDLVSLKDKLKKDELIDLDLTAYDHNYDDTNVKLGLQTSLFSGAMVYTLLVKKQYYYNGDVTDNTQTAALTNIAFGGGSNTGVVWNDLRPALQLIKIIEAIETDYDITFSRHFFGRAEFTGLFLWLNSSTNKKVGGSIQVIDWDGGSSANVNLSTNKGSFLAQNTPASNDSIKWKFELEVTPDAGNETIDYKIKLFVDDTNTKETNHVGTQKQKYTLEYTSDRDTEGKTFELYYEVETDQEFDYTATWLQKRISTLPGTPSANFTTTASSNTIPSFFTVSDNLPKIKLTDLLKGLFQAFKLVSIPQNDGTIYVNTLQSFYDEGTLYDFTSYVEYDNVDVARGDILNEINFNFQEPSTILNIEFEKNTRIAYGDEEALLTDSSGEPLDGKKLEFKIPFEQIVYERLIDQTDNGDTWVQYGAVTDETIEPVNPKAHIFYNINTDLNGKFVGFINESGTKSDLGLTMNIVSHTETLENPQFAFIFSSEFSTFTGDLLVNNLYTNYHQKYINNIFNIKRRNFKYQAKEIPLNILAELTLNDVLQIKQDYYRIDNMNLNIVKQEAELNLINAFDLVIGAFTPSETSIYVDFRAQQASIYVTFLDNYTAVKIDAGDGTGWVTITNTGSNVYFDFLENMTEFTRTMFVTFTNTDTDQTFDVFLNQESEIFPVRLDFSRISNSQYIMPLLINRT